MVHITMTGVSWGFRMQMSVLTSLARVTILKIINAWKVQALLHYLCIATVTSFNLFRFSSGKTINYVGNLWFMYVIPIFVF